MLYLSINVLVNKKTHFILASLPGIQRSYNNMALIKKNTEEQLLPFIELELPASKR